MKNAGKTEHIRRYDGTFSNGGDAEYTQSRIKHRMSILDCHAMRCFSSFFSVPPCLRERFLEIVANGIGQTAPLYIADRIT